MCVASFLWMGNGGDDDDADDDEDEEYPSVMITFLFELGSCSKNSDSYYRKGWKYKFGWHSERSNIGRHEKWGLLTSTIMTSNRIVGIQMFSMKSSGVLPTKSGLHPHNQAGSTTHLPVVEHKEGHNGKDYSNGRRALQKPRLLLLPLSLHHITPRMIQDMSPIYDKCREGELPTSFTIVRRLQKRSALFSTGLKVGTSVPHFTIIMSPTALRRWQAFSKVLPKKTATKKYQVAMPKQPVPKQTLVFHIVDSIIVLHPSLFRFTFAINSHHIQGVYKLILPTLTSCTIYYFRGNPSKFTIHLHQVSFPPKKWGSQSTPTTPGFDDRHGTFAEPAPLKGNLPRWKGVQPRFEELVGFFRNISSNFVDLDWFLYKWKVLECMVQLTQSYFVPIYKVNLFLQTLHWSIFDKKHYKKPLNEVVAVLEEISVPVIFQQRLQKGDVVTLVVDTCNVFQVNLPYMEGW